MALTIEAIDKQFIHMGTKNYELVIDIGGAPDIVKAKGHMEGFIQDWDAANGQLYIKSDEVTRLIEDVFWEIELAKGQERLMGRIEYDVIKALPIFQTLGTIHLYRDVPINWDILIYNFPDFLRMDSQLVGIKSIIESYGMNFQGRIASDTRFSINLGDVRFILSSELGELLHIENYPYVIEAGSPPAILMPTFIPKGDYGELVVPDVPNAFSYEWTFQEGDDASWNLFDATRILIDPSEVVVEYGHLQATITFPNIAGAGHYEYRLESAFHNRTWTAFTGTLENGMITTIIPGLQEGQEYTLFLRVASPWVGAPIQLTIYGGVFGYVLTQTPANQIIVFSTAVADGAFVRRIKRIHLPSEITAPSGMAVSGNTAYVSQGTNNTIYVLDIDVNDGQTASISRRFTTPQSFSSLARLDLEGDVLFMQRSTFVDTFSATTANMQQATLIEDYRLSFPSGVGSSFRAMCVDDELIIAGFAGLSNLGYIGFYGRDPAAANSFIKSITATYIFQNLGGLDIFDDLLFAVTDADDEFYIINKNISGRIGDSTDGVRVVRYPVGVTVIHDISVPG